MPHERCFGENRDVEIERAYRSDPLLLRLRAKNLVLPLADLSYPTLAEALHHVKPDLAALIACHMLEALIREVADLLDPALARSRPDLEEVINGLPDYGGIDRLRKATWKRLKRVRNELFHEGRQPAAKEISDLVAEVVQLDALLAGSANTAEIRRVVDTRIIAQGFSRAPNVAVTRATGMPRSEVGERLSADGR